jgi:cephalosporin-C deacetylase
MSDDDPKLPSHPPLRESVRAARVSLPPPSDLEEFWRATVEELARAPLDATARKRPTPEVTTFDCASLGGARLRCYCASGASSAARSPTDGRALVVTSHGYGSRTDAEQAQRLARLGFNVVAFDVRGHGESLAPRPVAEPGWVLTGIESRQQSILRGAVSDYLLAARLGLEHFGAPARLVFHGFSMAGGLATMAAGALGIAGAVPGVPVGPFRTPDLLAIGVPSFGDVTRRIQLCQAGSGRELADYVARHPERAADARAVMAYFDAAHLAPHVHCRVVAGVAVIDPVVPATTVFTILNALPRPPELIEVPYGHTGRREEQEWLRWESAWIRAALGRDERRGPP